MKKVGFMKPHIYRLRGQWTYVFYPRAATFNYAYWRRQAQLFSEVR